MAALSDRRASGKGQVGPGPEEHVRVGNEKFNNSEHVFSVPSAMFSMHNLLRAISHVIKPN